MSASVLKKRVIVGKEISIDKGLLTKQIGTLRKLSCKLEERPSAARKVEGTSIKAIEAMGDEYIQTADALNTLIRNSADFFQNVLDSVRDADYKAGEQFRQADK